MTESQPYFTVSYSSLGTAETCWRKFELDKFYPRRERVFEDNYAADVGSALHAGFQDYLIHGDKDEAIWQLMRAFPFEAEYNQDNDYRSFEATLSTLECMFEEVKLNEYELAKIRRPNTPAELAAGLSGGVVVPAIEVPFELRFKGLNLPDGRGIAFTGFIDAVMRHYTTGRFRTLDIKTTRFHMSDATAKYKFNGQQVPYGIVVEHIAEAAVDSFEVLYLDSYIDLVEPDVKLYPFTKTQDDIREWVLNKVLQFQQMIRFSEMEFFPRTDGGCTFFNKPCRHLEPCMSRDKAAITEWFLLGEEPARQREEFFPWIVADLEIA